MDQDGDKTHDATPFRRQKAREDGQVAKSQDLTSALVLVGGLLAMAYTGSAIGNFLGGYTSRQLASPSFSMSTQTVTNEWYVMSVGLAQSILPLFLLLMLIGIASNIMQVGFMSTPKKIMPDIKNINPIQGFKRMFSLNSLMRLIFGLIKITIVAAVGVWALWGERDMLLALPTMGIMEICNFVTQVIFWTAMKIGIALLIIAILDFAYQKWKFSEDIKMTTQEMKEEFKTLQGDPQILSRRKQVQRQMAMNRMENSVPKADVVVTNPTELAIALQYDLETMAAPVVVAKGAGVLAQKIRRLALENDIPVVEKKDLAQFLYKNVDVNHPIPPEQYTAVAEILRYVYELKGKELPAMKEAA